MVKQAVEDEIYDYGYYGQFYQIEENIGTPKHWIARVRIYINPVYNSTDKYGEVIYKLMPYGQIYRLFYVEANDRIRLDGARRIISPSLNQATKPFLWMMRRYVGSNEVGRKLFLL